MLVGYAVKWFLRVLIMFKQTVYSFSDHIFPGIGHSFSAKAEPFKGKTNNEVNSNFPLQMALFFNIILLPVWLTTIVVMMPLKYEKLPELNKTILIIALTAVIVIEFTRLYMGYLGNLTVNIPGLAGFWMLSILLQSPLQLLLLHPLLVPSVVEYVTQAIMCLLLVSQMVSGFFAIQNVARHSSTKFHTSQFIADR